MTVLLAQMEPEQPRAGARGAGRYAIRLCAWMPERDRRALIYNLSLGGMLVRVERELMVGETVQLELPEAGKVQARVVRIESRNVYGCQFHEPISEAALGAALLKGGFGG
ncbi:PilZ domain-containing protein [Altererythrobacter sp. B11]|uniref:PilZ domain-containing protein n=1 Tax=Altererythrobacter sp. B11 TaxID=2060312 RepID=UPI000DC72B1F|nr:PilZ domain-containing protein [Altererythrobacter sp. B11]BBC73660.1 PilZ domain-containing protein [Altererythrobacter sp. B11]